MYAYIQGIVTESHTDNSFVLENQGIGYYIHTSQNTLQSLKQSDSSVKIFTHLYVREDHYSLYGFSSKEELKLFLLLVTVSGIGPKAAISILSTLTPSKFSLCVITGDVSSLTKAQGIGKKSAERIILELKDKIQKEHSAEPFRTFLQTNGTSNDTPIFEEALEALLVLGYPRDTALTAIRQHFDEMIPVEDLIKKALKSLSKHA